VELSRSGILDEGGLADGKEVVGSGWWAESARSVRSGHYIPSLNVALPPGEK
jgi:hypothetical protein